MNPTAALRPNRTLAKLRAGQSAFGTLSLLPEPSLPELIGASGYDFYVIDTEHAAIDGQDLVHVIRACHAAGVTAIVRVRHVEEKELLWILDSGAEGLMVPLIEDAETARRAARLTHYPDEGERTLCSATRAAAHGAFRSDFAPYLAHSNQNVMLVGLIETPRGLENIDQIVREDIDVFCVGRGDLSLKMGYGYAPRHPSVMEAAKRILQAAIDAGKEGSVVAYDLEDAEYWMRFGCRFVIYSQPEMVLASFYTDGITQLNELAGRISPATAARV
jgi:2-keto-3-deoxy-L-rhamnonate aldolase RhmA